MNKDFEKIIEHLNSDTVSNDEKVKLYKAPSFQGLVLKELVQAFYEEKHDRIKSDKKQSRSTWIGNGLMLLTLIVALVALFK